MSSWHVSDDDLRAWIEGRAGMTAAVSVEQHVERCAECQASTSHLDADEGFDFEASWTAIRDAIEPQPLPWLGRLLRRLGVSESSAWVTSAAPALTGAWTLAVALVLTLSAAASAIAGPPGQALFLIIAPLLPMAGVASAYGSEVDPTYELGLAAPYSKLRMLMMRTVTVIVGCVPAAVLAGLAMSGPWWLAVAWLLPSAAFVLVTLAAATYMSPHYAAIVTGLVWVTVVTSISRTGEPVDLFSTTALVTYAAIGLTCAVILMSRSRHLATEGRTR